MVNKAAVDEAWPQRRSLHDRTFDGLRQLCSQGIRCCSTKNPTASILGGTSGHHVMGERKLYLV